MANLVLWVIGAFAEFERALIRERQREGIAAAKQRGAYRGRQRRCPIRRSPMCAVVFNAGKPKAFIACEHGISRDTLYQYLRTEH
jgi:DNA invertase Pin-like site-specific DNA recombinase